MATAFVSKRARELGAGWAAGVLDLPCEPDPFGVHLEPPGFAFTTLLRQHVRKKHDYFPFFFFF